MNGLRWKGNRMKHRRIKEKRGRSSAPRPGPVASRDMATVEPVHKTHCVELAVQHELLSEPRMHFSSLVIHRITDGVCLQGVVEVENDAPKVDCLVRRVTGVETVVNHLLVHESHMIPAKG